MILNTPSMIDTLNFLTHEQVHDIRETYGSPVYIYSEQELEAQGKNFLAFPHAYGLTTRYAMKASPNKHIVKIFSDIGIKLDCSSGYEAERAIRNGLPGANIQLTGQEFPHNIAWLIEKGVQFNATSLTQLERYGDIFPGTHISIRFNPGAGSGGNQRTNVGGPSSSFGIWHEYIENVHDICKRYDLTVTKLHTHIGSGSDPEVWTKVAHMSLSLCHHFPKVHTMNLGGGYKIARMSHEVSADIQEIGGQVKKLFEDFHETTGRKLHLEIEPGTAMVANACSLITTIHDIVDTRKDGYTFLKIDSGMTEVTRPSMYGSQHPLIVVNDAEEMQEYIVAGHCCESGDILTPVDGDPEGLAPRLLNRASIGDALVVEGVGAYCSAMSTKNYNSFPEAAELMLMKDGTLQVIRERQKPEDVWMNET